MPKYFKKFITTIITFAGLAFCLLSASLFIAIFSKDVALILLYIAIGLIISAMFVYIICCFIGLVKLLKEDWD